MTDVHWSDGKTTWIEAQLPYDDGVDPIEVMDHSSLDADGDGTVDYVEGEHIDEPTDGSLRIEVFDSRGAAELAYGEPFPANW
jgi:hypothetical protein